MRKSSTVGKAKHPLKVGQVRNLDLVIHQIARLGSHLESDELQKRSQFSETDCSTTTETNKKLNPLGTSTGTGDAFTGFKKLICINSSLAIVTNVSDG